MLGHRNKYLNEDLFQDFFFGSAPTAPRLTIQTENTTSTTQTHTILQGKFFLTLAATQHIPTVTTTDIKTNMCHIHTSIVPRHLATRGNNKIRCTPPPHISSSEERLPRLTLVQLRTNNLPSSNHTYTKSTPNHIHHHTAPMQHPHKHHLFNCTHIRTTLPPLDLWTDPARVMARWRDKLAGGPKAGSSEWVDTTKKIMSFLPI